MQQDKHSVQLPEESQTKILKEAEAAMLQREAMMKESTDQTGKSLHLSGYLEGWADGATFYATRALELQQENDRLRKALQEAFTTIRQQQGAVWVKAHIKPKIGDCYYCKVDTCDDNILKTIVEWAEFSNGNHKYYDWDLKNVQHFPGFNEEAHVIEWLDESHSTGSKEREIAAMLYAFTYADAWDKSCNAVKVNDNWLPVGDFFNQFNEQYKK